MAQSPALKNAREASLLRELAIDFDWNAAAKRAGISNYLLNKMKDDKGFMKKAKHVIDKGTQGFANVEEAQKKFHETQKALMEALEMGEFGVASSLMKSHEMEFRMHGLFEKDNQQKGSAVQINISLDAPEKDDKVVDAIEHEENENGDTKQE